MRSTTPACPRPGGSQPVGEPRGMAVHESQSLLIEMQVCRSPAFLGYLAPLLAATFGARRPGLVGRQPVPPRDPRRARLHPGRRRRGDLSAARDPALPPGEGAARGRPGGRRPARRLERGHAELLGLTPPDDRLGCLQDIHWPVGAIGYFPCYTLGAIMAAQLFEAASAAEPEILAGARARRFLAAARLAARQRPRAGLALDMPELLTQATGRPLELQPFLDHLRSALPRAERARSPSLYAAGRLCYF